TCVITGAFKELADKVVKRFNVDHAISACEYLFNEHSSRLERATYFPSDYFGKVDFMKIIMREHRATPYDCIFIGDGKNDVPLASHVAVSFAFNAQPELREVATESIDQKDGNENLSAVLRLLSKPTERMLAALETNVPTRIVGQPKYIDKERGVQLW